MHKSALESVSRMQKSSEQQQKNPKHDLKFIPSFE